MLSGIAYECEERSKKRSHLVSRAIRAFA